MKDKLAEIVGVTIPDLVEKSCAALKGSHEPGVLVDLQIDIADSVGEDSVAAKTVFVEILLGLVDKVVTAAVATVAVDVMDQYLSVFLLGLFREV